MVVGPRWARLLDVEPEMVLDKPVLDGAGDPVGRIVDVGVFPAGRVKFLVVRDDRERVRMRRFAVDDIDHIAADSVRLRVRTGG